MYFVGQEGQRHVNYTEKAPTIISVGNLSKLM